MLDVLFVVLVVLVLLSGSVMVEYPLVKLMKNVVVLLNWILPCVRKRTVNNKISLFYIIFKYDINRLSRLYPCLLADKDNRQITDNWINGHYSNAARAARIFIPLSAERRAAVFRDSLFSRWGAMFNIFAM